MYIHSTSTNITMTVLSPTFTHQQQQLHLFWVCHKVNVASLPTPNDIGAAKCQIEPLEFVYKPSRGEPKVATNAVKKKSWIAGNKVFVWRSSGFMFSQVGVVR